MLNPAPPDSPASRASLASPPSLILLPERCADSVLKASQDSRDREVHLEPLERRDLRADQEIKLNPVAPDPLDLRAETATQEMKANLVLMASLDVRDREVPRDCLDHLVVTDRTAPRDLLVNPAGMEILDSQVDLDPKDLLDHQGRKAPTLSLDDPDQMGRLERTPSTVPVPAGLVLSKNPTSLPPSCSFPLLCNLLLLNLFLPFSILDAEKK